MKPGELRDRLERYVALRRAVGFPMRAEERLLRDFVTFVEHRGMDEAVRSQMAVEWACHGDHRGPTTQARRLSVVRGFLAHVRASVPQTEVPPEGAHRTQSPARPIHLYGLRRFERWSRLLENWSPPIPCGRTRTPPSLACWQPRACGRVRSTKTAARRRPT